MELTLSDRAASALHNAAVDEALEDTARRIREPALRLAAAQVLEGPRNAGERPAGAGRADKGLQAAGEVLRLGVDLGAGRLDMDRSVSLKVAARMGSIVSIRQDLRIFAERLTRTG